MKTIKSEAGEYKINDGVEIAAEKELCLAELKLLRSDCVVKWDNPADNVAPRLMPYLTAALIFSFAAVFSLVFSLAAGEGTLFLVFLGIAGACVLGVPFVLIARVVSVKRRNAFFRTADIYPARITRVRLDKKDYYDGDGFYYAYRIFVWYDLFTPDGEVKKNYILNFETVLGQERDSREDLYDYYKAQKYYFMIYDPKKGKAYPVRLYEKSEAEVAAKPAADSAKPAADSAKVAADFALLADSLSVGNALDGTGTDDVRISDTKTETETAKNARKPVPAAASAASIADQGDNPAATVAPEQGGNPAAPTARPVSKTPYMDELRETHGNLDDIILPVEALTGGDETEEPKEPEAEVKK